MSKQSKRRREQDQDIPTDAELLHQRVMALTLADEALIQEVMARFGHTREEAIEVLREFGGL
jgi:hypothetical protein